MKRGLIGFIAGLMLATVSIGGAATSRTSYWRANGVMCTRGGGGIACVLEYGGGYGVGISRDVVLVRNNDTHRTVFTRFQP